MCGISGIVKKKPNSLDLNTSIKKMSGALLHRGPDDYAEYKDEVCAISIRRLAIQDLSLGIYPFKSEDDKLALVFNGEIYNYPELRNILSKEGFKFKTNCDAEAVLFGYQKWGDDVFSKLRGMFAIAIWNSETQKLTLVRDRVGIKPVYYIDTPNLFAFSSEAKSFFVLDRSDFTPELDYANTELLLGFMFLPKSNETVIKGVKKLEPATILEIQNGVIRTKKFWTISNTKQNENLDFAQAVNNLDLLLNESITMHLLSDAPLGVLLSGGIDSSLITAIMSKNGLNNSINTYTAKFDHKYNESELAKSTADYLGTNHTEIQIDTKYLNKNIETHISMFDDLTTFDGGIFTTKILCAQINKNGTKVLLLGEGADEIFGGYSWFGLSDLPFSILPAAIRNAIYYYALSRNVSTKFLKYAKFWNDISDDTGDVFRDITRRELELQLPNHLLMKVDKGSMASSIEARVPYLDHKLVEFVYSLPKEFKLKGNFYSSKIANEKYILREVAKRYLPSEVVSRKKRGFMLPMNDVLNQDLDKVKSYILNPQSVSIKILGKSTVEKLFNSNVPNIIKMQHEYFLWRLFILEVWSNNFNIK